ncbi:MAG TPA: SRPBCC family protein [Gammaproteobacteria bacterium]|nr:SRPBCC family protein [Gammaproteobacteria bacterium]
MKISSNFALARPRDEVWAMFQDVPRVATCIPGTQITAAHGDNKFSGRVEVKLGPIATAFEGDAEHTPEPAQFTGMIAGSGRDRGAGSRAKFTTVYRLTEGPSGTEVAVESDVTLAGAVAQFGRTGLMQEVTNRMLQQFAANLEARMIAEVNSDAEHAPAASAAAAPASSMNLGALLWSSLLGRLRALLGRVRARAHGRRAEDEHRAH